MCHFHPTVISVTNCTSNNVGFPDVCQVERHMASQIKADTHSVPLSVTLGMCPHLMNLPRLQ